MTAAAKGIDLETTQAVILIVAVVAAGGVLVYSGKKIFDLFGSIGEKAAEGVRSIEDTVTRATQGTIDTLSNAYEGAVDATSRGIETAVDVAGTMVKYSPVGLAVQGVNKVRAALAPTPLSPIEAGMKTYVGDLPLDDSPGFVSNHGGAATGLLRKMR